MYLFTRAGQFRAGSMRDAAAFATTVTEKVRQESDLDVHAWVSTMSAETGTCTWAAWVSSLEELEAANDKLAVSDQFNEIVEKGSELFTRPVVDGLANLVNGEIDPSAPLPAYVGVARAIAANGHVADSITAGVEIAEAADRITGVPTRFLVDVTGPIGGCRWVSPYADIGALQAAEEALAADPSWAALIDRVGIRYAQGATQSIHRRIT
jgi:hypothetical protein